MVSQSDADALLRIRKWFPPGTSVSLPVGKRVYELESDSPEDRFVLDTWRGSIRLSKVTMQNRARTSLILARLDLGGAPHTNPDGELIPSPHLHVYREGYDDKWAYPLDPSQFVNPHDLAVALVDFCRFCAIDPPSEFQDGLL